MEHVRTSTWLGSLALVVVLGRSQIARADAGTGSLARGSAAAPVLEAPHSPENGSSEARRRPLGLMFDLGSMHGAMLSLAYRPAPWLRLHAGAGTNAVSPGYRAGVTVAVPGSGPTLNVEGGHFFPGDMNGLLKVLVGTGYRPNPRLEEFDYDFINVHAGWELEVANLIFFARGGVSVLWTTLAELTVTDASGRAATTASEPLGLVLPSVAVGFVGLL
jgi:hypothetical protein